MRFAICANSPARQPSGLARWLVVDCMTPLRDRLASIIASLHQQRVPRRMELVEILALGGKRQLLLVVCDGQRYLVGAAGDGVQTIVPLGQPSMGESAAKSAEPIPVFKASRKFGIRVVPRPDSGGLGCGS